MRYLIIDQNTMQIVKPDSFAASGSLPAGSKAQFVPRIRCLDCPGKLYNSGPDQTIGNFQTHLNNKQHKQNVEKRNAA